MLHDLLILVCVTDENIALLEIFGMTHSTSVQSVVHDVFHVTREK